MHGRSASLTVAFKLSKFHKSSNFFLRKIHLVRGDSETFRVSSSHILSGHLQNSIRSNVECHIDFFLTVRGRSNVIDIEVSNFVVVLGKLSLSLENFDPDCGLVVGRGLILLSLRDGYSRVALDNRAHQLDAVILSFDSLNAQGQRSDVQKQDVCALLHINS